MGPFYNVVDRMEMEWMNETVDRVYKNNWIYKVICFFIRRKLSFKELYMILERVNESHLGEAESKKRSLYEILKIYKFQNNKYPEEILDNESK